MIAHSTIALRLLASLVSIAFASPTTYPPTLGHFIAPTNSHPGGDEAPISYRIGSPVLTGDVNIYYIYYGNFSSSQKSILEDFAKSVGSSSWYSTTRQYYYQASNDAPKEFVNGSVHLAGTVVDEYSRGHSLSGNDIPGIIQEHVDANKLPEDGKGVYFFFHGFDVSESVRNDAQRGAAFCEDYCGYHLSWELTSGTRIFYAAVGNPLGCLKGCAPPPNVRVSPNNSPGIDAMITTMAHELTEAVTDPWAEVISKRAWEDSHGFENADKCRTYGISSVTETGARYNHEFGGRKWMIQQNWSPVSQGCVSFV